MKPHIAASFEKVNVTDSSHGGRRELAVPKLLHHRSFDLLPAPSSSHSYQCGKGALTL